MSEQEVDGLAKTIWDYMLMHLELRPADVIVALGTSDIRVAERAAELFHQGYSKLVVATGWKRPPFTKSEAEIYADVLIQDGVPVDRILIEPKAANTGENILFVRQLLQENHIDARSVLLVAKPYMERRAWAVIKKLWPEIDCLVTSPQISYEDWHKDGPATKDRFLGTMIGDLQRIREYPKYGFQIEQEIPENVWKAQEKLVALGYGSRPPKPPLN